MGWDLGQGGREGRVVEGSGAVAQVLTAMGGRVVQFCTSALLPAFSGSDFTPSPLPTQHDLAGSHVLNVSLGETGSDPKVLTTLGTKTPGTAQSSERTTTPMAR